MINWSTKTLVALSIICFGLIVAFWLHSFDVVIGHGLADENHVNWRAIIFPHDYFAVLYVAELVLMIAGLRAHGRNNS